MIPRAAVLIAALAAVSANADRDVTKSILVTVLDGDGNPIRHLEPGDFSVREDGVVRRVIDARPATDPLYIAVLIDTTKPLPGIEAPIRDMRVGLGRFVSAVHTASPDAQICLIETGGAAVVTVNYTTKTADLDRSIRRLFPSQRSAGVLLEGLLEAGQSLAKKPSPRRVIVSLNFASPESSTVPPAKVAQVIRESGTMVWAVSISATDSPSSFQAGAQGTENSMASVREVLLNNLPLATGGMRLTAVTPTAIETLLARVADTITAQYLVSYERPDGETAKVIEPRSRKGSKVLMANWVR